MNPLLSEWLNLTLRWIHVITGVAWIGTSFYFNWLNSRLETPDAAEPGVAGELWSVHGGGFYRVLKYEVAPARLPRTLHWFKWEAYSTWISGFTLLVLIYYLGADAYLLDPRVSAITRTGGIALGLATLAGAWLVYDLLCRSPLGKTTVPFTVIAFALAAGAAYGLTQVFSSRAAYMHVGAMLGTLMAANVFRVIIPSQREMVDTMAHGRPPSASLGRQAALRSLHNNYMTLPVLFIMVSNHYPMTYGSEYNWAILAALAVIGAGTRHYFNLRNQGRQKAWILPAAALGMIGLALITSRRSGTRAGTNPGSDGEAVSFAAVRAVIERRCVPCHSAAPTNPGFPAAPGGVMFDTPEQIGQRVDRIEAVAVASETMPLGNLTGMTPEERELLEGWIRTGAKLK